MLGITAADTLDYERIVQSNVPQLLSPILGLVRFWDNALTKHASFALVTSEIVS